MRLVLKSKDGEEFEVEKAVGMQMGFVRGMLEGKFHAYGTAAL